MANSRSTTSVFTGLMRASAFGRKSAVRAMLDEGADPNARGPRGATALMFAASGGHLDVVKDLIEHGAAIDVEEDGGWNAKRHAQEDGHDDVARFLSDIEEELLPKWGRA